MATGLQAYLVTITLVDSEPTVWRRVLVPAQLDLAGLHLIIQQAMGWENLHDYCFHQGLGTTKRLWNTAQPLDAVFAQANGQPFYYHYDFVSGWRHRLEIESLEPVILESETLESDKSEILASNPGITRSLPICIAGAAACPPENSGGVWGYDELLARLEDLDDPDYLELLDRYGDFDPDAFDLSAVNHRLQSLCYR